MSDEGVGSVVMLSLLALAALVCLAVADAANVLVTRGRAQAAADAAALAAAAAEWSFSNGESPEEAAREVSDANGAELVSCDCEMRSEGADVVVSMRTRIRMLGVAPATVRAEAVATFDPGRVFDAPDRATR